MHRDRPQGGEGCALIVSSGSLDVTGALNPRSLLVGGSGGCFSPGSKGTWLVCFTLHLVPGSKGDRGCERR